MSKQYTTIDILSGKPIAKSRSIIWIITASVVSIVLWSAFAPLEIIVRGTGRVVPAMKTQVVQNLEGGIVRQIFVTEGDIVDHGQEIARMDETQFLSAFQELSSRRLALRLRLERLQSERNLDEDFHPSQSLIDAAPSAAQSEIDLYNVHRNDLLSTLASLTASSELNRRTVEMLRPMVERSAVPEIEMIRAEQAAVDAEGRIAASQSEFEVRRAEEYSEALLQLSQVEEQMRAREDQLARTNVTSPVHGIVNRVLATTVGGVVRPGEPLVEILPLDEQLRVEARIDPRDIGFVAVGMPAAVKLTAFDFSIYGTLTGRVVHVGASTVLDEGVRDPRPYYEVFVELDSTTLIGPDNEEVEIRPGMQASVELISGERTVLQYLLKPLFKTTEAFTER